MPAQTLTVVTLWRLGKGTVGDMNRNHQDDLENYTSLAAANLMELAGEELAYEVRCSTQGCRNDADARRVDFWLPAVLSIDLWTSVFETTSRQLPLLVPREHWVFNNDAAGYEDWHKKRNSEGATFG